MQPTYSSEQLSLTLQLGTSTLFEASNLKNCALDSQIRPIWMGAEVAGPAYPVACAPGDNLCIQLALEKAPAGSILVVTTDNFIAGYWGEVLTVAAKARHIRGLVIDGGVRDIKALRKHQFPVFSRSISVRGTYKETLVSVGKPIEITGTPVSKGDLVIADEDGVIILPSDQVSTIIQKGTEREEKERLIMNKLIQGSTTLELMGLESKREKV